MLVGAILAIIAAIIAVLVVSAAAGKSGARATPASGSDWWPPSMTAKQRLRFEQLVLAYFAQRGQTVRLDDGLVLTDEETSFGLQNIAQLCAQSAEHEWPGLIAYHFDNMDRAQQQQQDLARRAANFDDVADQIVPRLWNVDLPQSHDLFVAREDLEGTRTALSYDLPTTVMILPPEHAARWGKSRDELFARALRNLEQHPVQIEHHQLEGDLDVWMLSADHFYAASHALLLHRYPQCIGPGGALVIVPHRHVVICHPIASPRSFTAPHRLVPIAIGMYREGPGSITPNLYWYRDGTFTRIPYELDDKAVTIRPPDGFLQTMERVVGSG